jgi:hypothetical protein
MSEEDAFLMGGDKVISTFTKADRPGTTYAGEILNKRLRQQTDVTSGALKTWQDGSPMMQLVVTIQLEDDDEHWDHEDEADDGRRNLYVRYKMADAVREAVKEAEADKLEIGGWLSVTYTGDAKPARRGVSGAKLFEAEYEAPDPSLVKDETDAYLADGDDPEDADPEPEPEPAPRRGRAAKAAPAKAAAPAKKATRRRAAAPESAEAF